jgi:hypothetical protein
MDRPSTERAIRADQIPAKLMVVPDTIVAEAPELRTDRYVVTDGEVALIEPSTRRVLEVIE